MTKFLWAGAALTVLVFGWILLTTFVPFSSETIVASSPIDITATPTPSP